jgi:hypothetical protein
MIFASTRFNNKTEVVIIISKNKKTTFVRRTSGAPFYTPIGKKIKRNIKKHNVNIHGENIIRLDRL